jgi:hypothetical protein
MMCNFYAEYGLVQELKTEVQDILEITAVFWETNMFLTILNIKSTLSRKSVNNSLSTFAC